MHIQVNTNRQEESVQKNGNEYFRQTTLTWKRGVVAFLRPFATVADILQGEGRRDT